MIDFPHRRHLRFPATDNQIHSRSCTTLSLYYQQITHITAVKIIVAVICCWVIFSSSIVRVVVAFVGRTIKRVKKCKQTPWNAVNGVRTVTDVARHERGAFQLYSAPRNSYYPGCVHVRSQIKDLNQE